MNSNEKFQGWKNYETWNVALYINNERNIYEAAKEFMKKYKGRSPYIDFTYNNIYFYKHPKTPDGVRWNSNKLSRTELNEMLFDLLD